MVVYISKPIGGAGIAVFDKDVAQIVTNTIFLNLDLMDDPG